MKIILEAGHTSTDPGAVCDPDGSGPIPVRREHAIATNVVALMRTQLPGSILTPDNLDYAAVQRWALEQTQEGLFVSIHVNAGRGNYGAIFFSSGSPRGRTFAELARVALRAQFCGIDWRLVPLPAPGWERAWNTIRHISESPQSVAGVLVEIGFTDSPAHTHLDTADGLEAVARALVAAVLAWKDTYKVEE